MHEADRLGVYVSQEAVERFKMAFGVSGVAIDAVRQRNNISLAAVNHAIQTFVRVLGNP